MLIPIESDNQIDEYVQFSTILTSGPHAGRNSRLAIGLEAVEIFTQFCSANDVVLALLLGDLFEAIGRAKITVIDAVSDVLLGLTDVCRVIKLLGNHGRGDKGMQDHISQAFRGMRNMTVVSEPFVYRPPEEPETRLCFIPYQEDKQVLLQMVERIADKNKKGVKRSALFLHNWVYGGNLRNEGYQPDEVFDPRPDLLAPFDITVTGHLHRHQTYKVGGGKVVVVGSPNQLDSSDEGDPRGFITLDTETMETKLIKLNFPEFKTIRIAKKSDLDKLPDLSNYFVRFVLENDSVPERLLTKIKAAARPQVEHDYGIIDSVRINLPKGAPFKETARAYVAHKKEKASDKRKDALTDLLAKLVKDSGAEL